MSLVPPGNVEELYELQDKLGSGHFATVWRCRERSSGISYAAKFIRMRRRKGSRIGIERKVVNREVEILQQLQHRHIMQLHDVFICQVQMVLVLELIQGGEFFDFVAEKESMSEPEASDFLLQLLDGLVYMHSLNIAHFDLKPENIMLQQKDVIKPKIKIIGFGMAQKIEKNMCLVSRCGLPEYVAPEVIKLEPLTVVADMWSVGVITYILLSGVSPFQDKMENDTVTNIIKGTFDYEDTYFNSTSAIAKDFISQMLVINPKERMTSSQALLHPWIKPLTIKQERNRESASINITNFRKFNSQRKWKLSCHMITPCSHFCGMNMLFYQAKEDEDLRACESDQEDSTMPSASLLRRRHSSYS
ncbi:death-associated protein kinase 2-like isoform X1 [Antechinus flavipes]|uniref:death-associated protein kinase 2-like isoform X1 n=1 Tax=Antechinus flavipes TaxID=38775 RepID=UPI002235B8E1|nr:death-associated protein kinase 2-like isoform X1 [Antechinus flavipes]XP_051849715.1 death-associated protein kinase 2-like isoform X1 [Antechinus flavipes]XP_051849716.1 death-associated protein kinase 2-like isoform X1 [Antechinus flavipes]